MRRRDVRWYSDWLNRDQSYSPQPYEHLARVLRDTGDPQKADAILYAGRERARKEARKRRQFGRWSGLTMLNLTMGYGLGYRYFRVVWWLIAITVVGALVLAKSMPADKLDIPAWLTSAPIAVVASPPESALLRYDLSDLLFASLDQLLPIVELDKSHDRLFSADMLPRWSRYWFYVQSIFGYLLGSFLVAGLAGLTQKN